MMILTRTPLRISLFGGGSDFPEFFQNRAGAVLSFTINKHVYVSVKEHFEPGYRISYSQVEEVETADQIQNDLIRACVQYTGTGPVEITTFADLPARSGLGGSSSFCVGLLNALWRYQGKEPLPEELAEAACKIEIGILGRSMGWQDAYAAAFGGLRLYQFSKEGAIWSGEPPFTGSADLWYRQLSCRGLLLYTGITRDAETVLKEQKQRSNEGVTREMLERMAGMAVEYWQILSNPWPFTILGDRLDQAWHMKKRIASGISNPVIDGHYQKALDAGAIGGKLLGAGGGGFLFFWAPKERHPRIIEATGLRPVPFSLDLQGSQRV